MTRAHDALRALASGWRAPPTQPLMPEMAPAAQALQGLSDDALAWPAAARETFKALGVFRCARPAEAAGLDFTPMQQARVIEEIGRIDVSAAWRCMIGLDSGIYHRYLPPEQAQALVGEPDSIAAGWVFPAGRARAVAGGVVVSGQWHFGSGIDDADLVVAGCSLEGATASVAPMLIAAPQAAFDIDRGSWDVGGLRASGSFSYSVRELYVPALRCFSLDAPVHPGPLTRRNNALVRKMPGVPLGAMRGLLDWAQHQGDGRPGLAELLARHEYVYLAARTAVYATLEAEWDCLCAGEAVSARSRALQAMARREAFLAARQCARELLDGWGTAALRRGSGPLMRTLRDLDAACQHAVVKPAIAQAAGALLMGRESLEVFV